jgi:hypothetical protein
LSPTSRTLALMRSRGFYAEVVERFIPGANIRRDLFGVLDVLCLGDNGELVGVQCTSLSNVSARIKKIAESPLIARLRKTNIRILVQGWQARKVAGSRSHEVKFREVDVS